MSLLSRVIAVPETLHLVVFLESSLPLTGRFDLSNMSASPTTHLKSSYLLVSCATPVQKLLQSFSPSQPQAPCFGFQKLVAHQPCAQSTTCPRFSLPLQAGITSIIFNTHYSVIIATAISDKARLINCVQGLATDRFVPHPALKGPPAPFEDQKH